jgi:hypothetical protein
MHPRRTLPVPESPRVKVRVGIGKGLAIMTTDSTGTPLPFRLTALDREILSMSNDEFSPHTWEEIKQIIGMS